MRDIGSARGPLRTLAIACAFCASFGIPALGNWVAFNYAFTSAEYGLASLTFALCAVAVVLGSLGLEYHILQLGRPSDEEGRQRIFGELTRCLSVVALGAIAIGVTLALALVSGVAGIHLDYTTAFLVGIFVGVGALSKVAAAALRTLDRVLSAIVVDRVVREGGMLFAALIVLGGVSVVDPVFLTFACSAVFAIAAFAWAMSAVYRTARPTSRERFLNRVPLRNVGELSAYSVSEMVFLRADVIVLGALLPAHELAPFAFYAYLSGFLGAGFLLLNFLHYPSYATLFVHGRLSDLGSAVRRVGVQGGLTSVAILGVLISVDIGHHSYIGTTAGLLSAPFLILATGQVASALFGPIVPALVVAKQSRRATQWYWAGTAARLLLVPFGYILGDLAGAALGSVLATIGTRVGQARSLSNVLEASNMTLRWPNLFLVGAPKCGTTAMFQYLSISAEVFCPSVKEPQFFCDDFPGLRQVKSERHYQRLYRDWVGQRYACDASVWYLFSKRAAERIYRLENDAKIIIMVRYPVDMVASFFEQATLTFAEDRENIEEAWRLIEARRSGKLRPAYCPEPAILDYRAIADFAPQIQRYKELFGPNRVHVIVFEELVADPERTLRALETFLGVSLPAAADFVRINGRKNFHSDALRRLVTKRRYGLIYAGLAVRPVLRALGIRPSSLFVPFATKPTTAERINPDFRDELVNSFREPVRKLEEYLGRELPFWRSRAHTVHS